MSLMGQKDGRRNNGPKAGKAPAETFACPVCGCRIGRSRQCYKGFTGGPFRRYRRRECANGHPYTTVEVVVGPNVPGFWWSHLPFAVDDVGVPETGAEINKTHEW